MTLRRFLGLACACSFLAACTVGPDYAPPEVQIAPAWRQPVASGAASSEPWWKAFRDPVLDRLQNEAQAGNLTIEQALARVDQARAAAAAAGAARLPVVEANGTAARAQQSLNSGLGQLSRYVPDLPRTVDSGSATLNGSWDLDLAGGIRRRQEAARASLVEAEAGVQAARLAVTAELAQAYFRLRTAEAQGRALAVLAREARDRAAIMQARQTAGAASLADAERTSALAEQAAAALPEIEARVEAERAQIAVLVGRSPSLPLDLAGQMPVLSADPVGGLPASVLRARPDVAMAEARLVASNAAIGAALAEYWPSISIGGLIGVQSNRFGELFTGDSVAIQGAVGLRWRLFDFERIDAQVASARGRHREMLAAYRETVLRATADVESGQAALMTARQAYARTEAEVKARAAALARDTDAFRAGAISKEELSASQTAQVEAEARLIAERGRVAAGVVGLARALALP
ncbi:transporter (plasmid) [Novosphingobium sp. THN1]|uniref:efflux transporter outer membrane subunit n=1 Tax=Novosphingobium sp. THN1 TaxID=1016987 RepID=UPI000E47B18A|nr:efflux transporter outer membrane subunit [Novosphingobium sp. THN1]AXU20896.1 transporter [Novosphingobium sp. THN1]